MTKNTTSPSTQKSVSNPFFQIVQKLYALSTLRQRYRFVWILLIMALSAILTQLTPKAIGYLTDDILSQTTLEFSTLVPVLFFILVVNILNEALKIFRRLLVEDTVTKTQQKARSLVLVSLLKAPLRFFQENMTGNIHGRLNRCLEGTIQFEKLVFMDLAPAIFNSIAAVIVILTTLPFVLALPMLMVIPIGMAIVFRQISTQKGIRVELLQTKSAMDGSLVELLNGIEVIRITDSVSQEEKRFDQKSEALRTKEMKHHFQMAKYDCFKFLNEALFTVLMIGMSSWLATQGVISVGAVLTSYLCFIQLIGPLEELHRILDELSESMVLAKDFFSLVELPLDFSYQENQELSLSRQEQEAFEQNNVPWMDTDKKQEPAIEICGLTFSYGSKTILNDLFLRIPKGTFIGLAGPSGCGKSSLIKAICKLENYQGEIWLQNQNLRDLTRTQLATSLALVPQVPFLIAGTIEENICYGLKEIPTSQEILQAIEKACLKEWIESLPLGLQTPISEGGSNLSGGQRQRLAIARIFLRQPDILILDEATSALDNTSERFIQSEIEKLASCKNMTVLSIAHRLTTLQNADCILVMDQGQIVEFGNYQSLIAQPGLFQDMYFGRLK